MDAELMRRHSAQVIELQDAADALRARVEAFGSFETTRGHPYRVEADRLDLSRKRIEALGWERLLSNGERDRRGLPPL